MCRCQGQKLICKAVEFWCGGTVTWPDIAVHILDHYCHIQWGPSHKDALLAQALAKLGGALPCDWCGSGHGKSDWTIRKPVLALVVKDVDAVRSCRA